MDTNEQEFQLRRISSNTQNGTLMSVRDLFCTLGSIISLPEDRFHDFVLGQYRLARSRQDHRWILEAQSFASNFFSQRWIQANMINLEGRRNYQRNRRPVDNESYFLNRHTRDIRQEVVPQSTDHPTQATVSRTSHDSDRRPPRPQSRHQASPRESSKKVSASSSSSSTRHAEGRRSPLTHRSRSYARRDYIETQIFTRRSSKRQSTPQPTQPVTPVSEPAIVIPRKSPVSVSKSGTSRKRPLSDSTPATETKKKKTGTSCPIVDCAYSSNRIKLHTMRRHLPEIFSEDLPDALLKSEQLKKLRLDALLHLTKLFLGEGKTVEDLATHVVENLKDLLPEDYKITSFAREAMDDFCTFMSWPRPIMYSLNPLTSPAVLMHWRILAILINTLTESQRLEFRSLYNLPETPRTDVMETTDSLADEIIGCEPGNRDTTSDEEMDEDLLLRSDSEQQSSVPSSTPVVPAIVVSSAVVSASTSTCSYADAVRKSPSTVPPPVKPKGSQEPVMVAVDSHFHLDRLCRDLGEPLTKKSFQKILSTDFYPKPRFPVTLGGGILNYCDPIRFSKIMLPTDRNFKVAIGVHPLRIKTINDERMKILRNHLSNSAVAALGEIGLDFTAPKTEWKRQEEVLVDLLRLLPPNKTLVLHLRGERNDVLSSEPSRKCLQLVQKYCSSRQKIHLHCFTGGVSEVRDWKTVFPNAYFGFTSRIERFNYRQRQGLREVGLNRLLLETDSPYMPPERGPQINTPRYIGAVAQSVSFVLVVPVQDVLQQTTENARSLYGLH